MVMFLKQGPDVKVKVIEMPRSVESIKQATKPKEAVRPSLERRIESESAKDLRKILSCACIGRKELHEHTFSVSRYAA